LIPSPTSLPRGSIAPWSQPKVNTATRASLETIQRGRRCRLSRSGSRCFLSGI